MRWRLIATGGTIASRAGRDGIVVPALSVEELVEMVPDIDAMGEFDVEEVACVSGWDMEPTKMVEVARRAHQALAEGIDGVVITHGTDTIEETALLVDLLVGGRISRGSIAFACAMRSANELGADGPSNLRAAATVAVHSGGAPYGAVVCVNGEIHAARWVSKWHTTSISTFQSDPFGPVGEIGTNGPRYWGHFPSRPPVVDDINADVAIIKAYSGSSGDEIRWHTLRGVSGLIVEGTGAGNVPTPVASAVAEAIDRGVVVVGTSRCPRGRVTPIYGGGGGGATLERLGVIPSVGLNSQKARIALMVALGYSSEAEAVRDWFEQL